MTKKIFRSICSVAVCITLAVLSIIMGVLYNYFSDIQKQRIDTQVQYIASAVELDGKEYLDKIQDKTFRMTWIAKDGKVLYDNEANSDEMENHLEREEVKQAIKDNQKGLQYYPD